jgi:hypothetical protein
MKQRVCFLMIVLAALLVSACSSSPQPAQISATEAPSTIQRDKVTIDFRGAGLGGQIPEWVLWAADADQNNQLADLPRLKGKIAIPFSSSGQNLDLLQAWVNLEAQGEAATRIKNTVRVEGGRALEGDKNTAGAKSAVDQFINNFSQATISGLGRELDFWIKERSKSSGEENFVYYVVYGITEENFNFLIEQALGKVQAETQEQKEMVNEIKDRMSRLRISVTE